MSLGLDTLRSSVLSDGTAFRLRTRLQPAGGPGDKVFPPTYAEGQDGRKHDTKYACEVRVVDGERKPTVLLDSVASQANRMELALLDARGREQLPLPLIAVDLGKEFPEIGRISALETPHRVYDAILRDALLEGTPFRASEMGRRLTDASPTDARAMYEHCPTALLLGAWDSTGPRGGLGNKFQRALVSEVVGIGFEAGTKVGSRIDPLQISAGVRINIPKEDSDAWSVDEKGKSKNKPSEVNHSNIAPTRDLDAGGVTFEYALHTAVLSLPALRRLKFGPWTAAQADAARVVLAALGLVTMALQRRSGYDFRSRCTLVPEGPGEIELVRSDGTVETLALGVEDALQLYQGAVAEAEKAGVRWVTDDIVLEPMPKLIQLIRASQAHMAAGGSEE